MKTPAYVGAVVGVIALIIVAVYRLRRATSP